MDRKMKMWTPIKEGKVNDVTATGEHMAGVGLSLVSVWVDIPD